MEINIILQFFTKGLPDKKILKIFLWGSASLLRSQLRAGVPPPCSLHKRRGATAALGILPTINLGRALRSPSHSYEEFNFWKSLSWVWGVGNKKIMYYRKPRLPIFDYTKPNYMLISPTY